MIMNEFITPLFLAIAWATLGCALIRVLWSTSYDRICAYWLLTVFGFTLFIRAVVLTYFVWPENILASSLTILGPVIAHFGYPSDSTTTGDEARWPEMLYGLFLLFSSIILTLTSKRIFADMLTLSNNSVDQIGFVAVTLVIASVGLIGLFIVYQSHKLNIS